jgi:predicted ATPase
VRLRFFGGFAVEDHDGTPIDVRGRGQQALLFRLALDAGTTVGYRALGEDVWPDDPPEDPRGALQSLASRLRRALPTGMLQAVPGGYRLCVAREDVDLVAFADRVTDARARRSADAAREALALWRGDPWTPDGFDWVVRDLLEDRAHAERLVADAAPIATSPAAPTAIPTPADSTVAPAIPAGLTALVGREAELTMIASQLVEERLVTLLGPGGAGKTTLALEIARTRPAAVFVELAPAAPGDVWDAVATALGRSIRLPDTATSTPLSTRERALSALAGRDMLLVLDNAEHVAAETATVVATILQGAPTVRVLITSREPLGVPGEAFVEVGSLPEADAVTLLSRRIRAARGRPPEAGEAEQVRRITRRLDGLPLALELAGAKARVLTVAEIEAGLADRFTLLDRGPRAAEPRHQTLRAVIDWSWDMLTADERDALLALAVFPDGIGVADVREVGDAFGQSASTFDALVDRSLVQRSRGRYRLLETVREYGLDVLARTDRLRGFRDRQADVVARIALAQDALLRTPRVREGVAWYDANEENLSAASRWCAAEERLAGTGILLTRAQFWVWLMRERSDALIESLQRFGPAAATLDSEPAVLVAGVALLLAAMRDDGDAELDLDRVAAVSVASERHPSELTAVLPALLRAVVRIWDVRRTPESWSSRLELHEEDVAGAPDWSRAFVAVMRAAVAQNNGDIEPLGESSGRALEMFRSVGDVWGIALASQMRAEWLTLEGRLDEALRVADASTEGLEGLTSLSDLLQQRGLGVSLLLRLGRVDEARSRAEEMIAAALADGSDRVVEQAVTTAASLEVAVGDGAAALRALDLASRGESGGRGDFPEQIVAWREAKRAEALLLLGQRDAAAESLRRAVPIAVRTGDRPIMSEVTVAIAAWFVAADRFDDARAALAEADRLRGRADLSDPVGARVRERLNGAGPDAAASDPADLTALLARI